jgi:hypothetical protein
MNVRPKPLAKCYPNDCTIVRSSTLFHPLYTLPNDTLVLELANIQAQHVTEVVTECPGNASQRLDMAKYSVQRHKRP